MLAEKLIGKYNNFQQFWEENTDETIHQKKSIHDHKHLHIKINKVKSHDSHLEVSAYEGRDDSTLISQKVIKIKSNSAIQVDGDDLIISEGLGIEDCKEDPYRLKRCRAFSGWIQYPPDISNPDELNALRDLELHDQGGIVELKVDDLIYAVELSQLVYAKTINVMKLAVYDIPKEEVGINSKAISYVWSNPEATRIGINIRKVISGWTLIEPNYINSNNLNS